MDKDSGGNGCGSSEDDGDDKGEESELMSLGVDEWGGLGGDGHKCFFI